MPPFFIALWLCPLTLPCAAPYWHLVDSWEIQAADRTAALTQVMPAARRAMHGVSPDRYGLVLYENSDSRPKKQVSTCMRFSNPPSCG